MAAFVLLGGRAAADDQVTTDPNDAYAMGSQGQSDIRVVEWHTSGPNVTAVLRMEQSQSFVGLAFLDVDRNGRADYALTLDGGSGSTRFDAKLRAVGASTPECQLYDPGDGTPPVVSEQPTYAVDDDGFVVLSVTFPASAIGGAGSFRWAAFGYTLNGMNEPGWDYAPGATNPDPSGPQPADRSCSVDQQPGEGIRLDLGRGVDFPTPPPSNTPPTAAFDFDPASPRSGDTVTFTSTSSDAEGPLASQRWDLDGDGQYDDATGETATYAFPRKGPNAVGLIVEDADGATATTARTVGVGNRPPAVTIVPPSEPVRGGQRLRLTAEASDDGEVTAFAWDLDDDGEYDDAAGSIAEPTFPRRGLYPVGVRVTDDDGATTDVRDAAQVDNTPPVAALQATPRRARADDGFLLDASGSTDVDGDRLEYTFRIGDYEVRTDRPTYRFTTTAGELGVRAAQAVVSDGLSRSRPAETAVEVLLPNPPQPVITGPDQRVVDADGTAHVSGRIDRISALRDACITVGVSTIPERCNDPAILNGTGRFQNVPVSLRPGVNRVTVWARDAYGQVASAVTELEAATESSGLDLRASMVEVTQGTQWATPPVLRDTAPGAARLADYNGVRLAHGGPTFARVFANVRSLARGGDLPRGVTVVLEGYSRGGRLAGGPLLPISGPATLRRGPTSFPPPVEERADPGAAYTFVLPDAWTRVPELRVDAIVDPAGVFRECASCRRDNTHSVRWIPFVRPTALTVSPVRLGPSPAPPMAASEDLDILRRVFPGGPAAVTIERYRATLDISAILADGTLTPNDRASRALGLVAAFEDRNDGSGVTLGVSTSGTVGGIELPVPLAGPRIEPIAVADTGRPLGLVAHEFGHALGLRHASHCRTATSGDPGNVFGVLAEGWSPDEQGLLQGYAMDLRPGSGGDAGPFRIFGPTDHDLMSYCARGEAAWISPRNWNRRLGGPGDQEPLSRARVAQAGSGPLLSVFASVDGEAKATILRVDPGAPGPATGGEAAADFRVVVRRADGSVLSDTPVAAPDAVVEGTTGRLRFIHATVPGGDGPESVDVVAARGGAVLATRRASPGRPSVTLGRPAVRRKALRVAWTASDPDGGPLLARVDVASDGRTYRTVAMDAARSPVNVPLDSLAGGRAARVRVTVSDGFRAAVAESAPFRLPAGKASVRILDPGPRSVLSSDATVVLRGEALTSAGKKAAITWFAGRRRLGRGRALTVHGLPAGRLRLRAVAPGGASDAVRLRVRAAAPRLVRLRAPARVGRRARSVKLRLAANQPAVLRVAGRRYSLDRRLRPVRVRIRPGRRTLALRLRLRAGGRSATQSLAIPRRRGG